MGFGPFWPNLLLGCPCLAVRGECFDCARLSISCGSRELRKRGCSWQTLPAIFAAPAVVTARTECLEDAGQKLVRNRAFIADFDRDALLVSGEA